jgi:hypothetical protein
MFYRCVLKFHAVEVSRTAHGGGLSVLQPCNPPNDSTNTVHSFVIVGGIVCMASPRVPTRMAKNHGSGPIHDEVREMRLGMAI